MQCVMDTVRNLNAHELVILYHSQTSPFLMIFNGSLVESASGDPSKLIWLFNLRLHHATAHKMVPCMATTLAQNPFPTRSCTTCKETTMTTTTAAPITITLVENTEPGGRLGKVHRYDEAAGKITTRTEAWLHEGRATKVALDSLAAFMEVRSMLGTSEALMMGVAHESEARIVTQAALGLIPPDRRRKERMIARDRAHISWPEGPAVVVLDLDRPDAFPPEIRQRAPTTPDGWRELLIACIPGLAAAPMAWAVSSSSCLALGDREVAGVRGQRFYGVIDAGQGIPQFSSALRDALVQRGLVWYEVSKSGSLLERLPFDFSVYVPEHLDFAAGPECVPPLTWRPPEPIIWNDNGPYLRSSDLPRTSEADQRRIDAKLHDLRRAKHDEATARRKTWQEETGRSIALRSQVDPAVAQEIAAAAVEAKLLLPEFLLTDSEGQVVSVGELLQDPAKHHGRRFHDPVEPDYRDDPRIAVFLATDGEPVIYSHAHGGQTWRCTRPRPVIRVELIEPAVSQISQALEHDPCELFRSGSELVRINEGEARMHPLDPEGLNLMLARRIRFTRQTRNGIVRANLSPRALKALLSEAPYLPVPELAAVVRGPFALSDGTIVDDPGYDPASHVAYVSASPYPPKARRRITLADAGEALRRLWYPVSQFPFKTAVDRGVALVALLTAVLRASLPMAPGYCITANAAGTGKTLLARTIGALQTGSSVALSPFPGEEEERRKHVFAALRQGQSYMLFDNADRGTALDSSVLANLITSPKMDDRVLKESRSEERINRMTVALTGNNLTLVGDLNRRILTIRLDAATERPWEREFLFLPPNHVLANWLELRIAALEVLQAWKLEGEPRAAGSTSFDEWDATARSATVWAGKQLDLGVEIGDPIEAIRASYADDPETDVLRMLLSSCHEVFAEREFQLKDIEDLLDNGFGIGFPANGAHDEKPSVMRLREARNAVIESLRDRGRRDGSANLGMYLDQHKDRIVGGLKFTKGGKRDGSRQWRVVRTEQTSGTSPSEVGVA